MFGITQSNVKFSFAIMAFVLAAGFFIYGSTLLSISDIFREGYEIQEKFEEQYEVDFRDPEPRVGWMDEISINQSDDDPLEVGQSLGFNAYVLVKEIPEELVIHIFHEDMTDFFLGEKNSDFKQLAIDLDRIPALQYSDMFSIYFHMNEQDIAEKRDQYSLNGFESYTFKKSGTYFAAVSVKTKEGNFDHYKSKTSVLEIKDPKEAWINTTLENLIDAAEEQKSDTLLAIGVAFLGIGFGIFFSGVNLLFSALQKK